MLEQPMPVNPRVNFFLSQGSDLQTWVGIPFFLGMMAAPLFDDSSVFELWAIVGAIALATHVWNKYVQRWLERRVGVARPSPLGRGRPPNWRLYLMVLGALVVLLVAMSFHPSRSRCRAEGWMDQEAGAWLVMAMLASMYRVIDLSNPRLRRLWNGAAACLLVAGWNLEGTSPESYAWMLVLTGAVLLVLALLDLWLLLHLAVTPLAPDPEDAHA